MTIRFSCSQCEAVLKIRDELAGTNAKCPKCKTAFVIPAPALAGAATAAAVNPQNLLEDFVDMPREVTPSVQFDTDDGFDPLDVLSSGSNTALPAVSPPPPDEAPKPSIAELMREHEVNMAAKKKKRDRKEKGEGLEAASGAAAIMTAGTATDALNRTYDQKRGKASEPSPLTREERRELEQKEALKRFAIKGGAGLAVVLFFGYFLVSWAFRPALPPLGYVTGVVTLEGKALTDVEVTFAPTVGLDGEALKNATPSTALTDIEGHYVLMYNLDNEGAVPAVHQVTIISPSGVSYILPPEIQQQTVNEGESREININL